MIVYPVADGADNHVSARIGEHVNPGQYQRNPVYRRRIQQLTALAELDTCLVPMCSKAPHVSDRPIGLCSYHAFDVWAVMDDERAAQPAMTHHQVNRDLRYEQQAKRDQAARDSAAIEPGWVYYILIDQRVKIGFSTDVKQRMRAYPPHSKLLAVHPGTPTLEREMHQRFSGLLTQGREWFLPATELMAHIDQVVHQYGKPAEKFIYRFRDATRHQTSR